MDIERWRTPLLAGLIITSILLFKPSHGRGNWSTGKIIESPITTVVSQLSKEDQDKLPYPPDALPGGRDVDSPYGSIRVFEWGPEDGRKVLLVHGISTPCVSLAGVAEELAKNGCRVMLFDLFGRGYSGCPDPVSNPQDIQLFTSQILIVLASSSLSWTGTGSFSIIGYSLGGGISASFTSYFPMLVNSLVLIAPSGLLRPSHIHWTSHLIYGGLLPQPLLYHLVRRRLGGTKQPEHTYKATSQVEATSKPPPAAAVTSELPTTTSQSHPALSADSTAPLFPSRPSISVADAVSWQLRHHAGFLPSFISSIQHAPISGQQVRWRMIGARLAAQKASPSDTDAAAHGLQGGKALMVLGKDDGVIIAKEVTEDAREVLGIDGVEVRVIEGGHDVPIAKSKEVAEAILGFWKSVERR